jgi:hypothetical protein
MDFIYKYYIRIKSYLDLDYRRRVLNIMYDEYYMVFVSNTNNLEFQTDFDLALNALLFSVISSKTQHKENPRFLHIDGKELCNKILQTTQIEVRLISSILLIYNSLENKIKFEAKPLGTNKGFRITDVDNILSDARVRAIKSLLEDKPT